MKETTNMNQATPEAQAMLSAPADGGIIGTMADFKALTAIWEETGSRPYHHGVRCIGLDKPEDYKHTAFSHLCRTDGLHNLTDAYVVKPDGALRQPDLALRNDDGDTDETWMLHWERINPGELILTWEIPHVGSICNFNAFIQNEDSRRIASESDVTAEQINTSKTLGTMLADHYNFELSPSPHGFNLIDHGWNLEAPKAMSEAECREKVMLDFQKRMEDLKKLARDHGVRFSPAHEVKLTEHSFVFNCMEYKFDACAIKFVAASIRRIEAMYLYQIYEKQRTEDLLPEFLKLRQAVRDNGGELYSLGEKGVFIEYSNYHYNRFYAVTTENLKIIRADLAPQPNLW